MSKGSSTGDEGRTGLLDVNLNVGCGPHRAETWINTDVVFVQGMIEPDVVVPIDDSFPFLPEVFDRVYVGHCIEHIPWAEVPDFLDQLVRVCANDAEVMFVGPDADRVIQNYADGISTWHDVQIIIEGPGAYTEATGFTAPRWDADRHHWCCNERRVVGLLRGLGWRNVTPYPVDEEGLLPDLYRWPLVSRARNQFAVSATIPQRS